MINNLLRFYHTREFMNITKKDIKSAIIDFFKKEYERTDFTIDSLDDENISLAYTDTEDEKHNVSVVLNLNELCFINLIDDIYVYSIEAVPSLEKLYEIVKTMSFDGLINFIDFDEIEDFLLDLEESQV